MYWKDYMIILEVGDVRKQVGHRIKRSSHRSLESMVFYL